MCLRSLFFSMEKFEIELLLSSLTESRSVITSVNKEVLFNDGV